MLATDIVAKPWLMRVLPVSIDKRTHSGCYETYSRNPAHPLRIRARFVRVRGGTTRATDAVPPARTAPSARAAPRRGTAAGRHESCGKCADSARHRAFRTSRAARHGTAARVVRKVR
ncbi:hypothetical protein GCM10027406_19920 [Leifsonia lichenia]